MRTFLLASVFVIASIVASAPANAIPAPIHAWTFDDGTARDVVGGLDGTLNGGATIVGGKLILDGSHDNGGSYMSTRSDTVTLTTKTLVSWVSLGNLTQGGGSALSVVQLPNQEFDAVDFGEVAAAQWISGSDFFNRTQGNNGGAPATDTGEHMVAITYGAARISLYVDGTFYADGGAFSPYAFVQPNYLIGLRHPDAEPGNGLLNGSVDQASIYDTALSADDVAGLYAQGTAVPEPATWMLMLVGLGAVGTTLRLQRKGTPTAA